jgi:DNA-binding transcriptional LysR family regulator
MINLNYQTKRGNTMDINLIKYFVTVAQTLNFSEAARQNFVSQSTVSRGIKEIEKELGAPLFSRTKRDVVLTPEGKALLPYAMEIIDNLNTATFTIEKLQKGIDGKITIGYDETSGPYISKYLKGFVSKYPDITVDIKKIEMSEEILALDNGEYDIVFMLRDMMPDYPDIEHFDAFEDTMSIICQKGMIKSCGVDFDILHNLDVVLLSESESPILYMEILDLFRTYNIIPKIVNRFDSIKSVTLAVSAGIGVSILPTSLCRSMDSGLYDIHTIKGIDTTISYIMAWNRKMKNPGTNLFLNEVKKIGTS